MKITWIQPYYDLILNEIPLNASKIIDVGAGYGIFGFILKKSRECEIHAVEPFDYDLTHYDMSFKNTWSRYFAVVDKRKHFDVLVSTEMIEHLPHKEAVAFITEAKQISNKVIIATPYQWEQQDAYDGNEYQIHQSHLLVSDFIKHGYNVHLLGTITVKGLVGRIYFHPKWLKILKLIGVKPTNIIAVWSENLNS